MAALVPSAFGQTGPIHVNVQAAPGGDGSNWQLALNRLQPALDAAASRGVGDREIWVAIGTYTPDPSATSDPFDATFSVPEGTELIGGFLAGENRSSYSELYRQTFLSGSIQLSGVMDPKVYTVVTIEPTTAEFETLIDGFQIVNGFASKQQGNENPLQTTPDPDRDGGGIYSSGANLEVRNCFINKNRATRHGGGLHFAGSFNRQLQIYRSFFQFNIGERRGGGLFVEGASEQPAQLPGGQVEPSWIYNCTFERNYAGAVDESLPVRSSWGGGGIYVSAAFPSEDFGSFTIPFAQATLDLDFKVSLLITNSRFTQNTVRGLGAAMYMNAGARGNLIAKNTFALNKVNVTGDPSIEGGTIYAGNSSNSGTSLNLLCSSIVYDHIEEDGALNADDAIAGPGLTPSSAGGGLSFPNLWVFESDVAMASVGTIPTPLGSTMQNYDVAPGFAASMVFDFRLTANSPLLDLASETWVLPDFPDIDGDGDTSEDVPTDFTTAPNQQRVVDLIGGSAGSDLDIGAFERQQ